MAIPKIEIYSIPPQTYSNKTAWAVEPDKAVLLIHDVQKYFVDFYDVSAEPMQPVLQHIKQLKQWANAAGIPVVYTAQPARQKPEDRALLTDFWGEGVQDDDAIAICEQLTPQDNDIVFTKWRYSAFQRTPLHAFMAEQGRNQLIICGVYAHIGILTTALEAFMTDIKPFVVADAVADFSQEDHSFALQYIAGRCGQVTTISELQKVFDGNSDQSNSKQPLTLSLMTQHVAQSIEADPSELDPEDNLMDWGLDSIRLMALVEQWRAYQPGLQFEHLAESATLAQWAEILNIKDEAACG